MAVQLIINLTHLISFIDLFIQNTTSLSQHELLCYAHMQTRSSNMLEYVATQACIEGATYSVCIYINTKIHTHN